MTTVAKILVFAGSARRGSYNKKLVPIATGAAREAGAEVTAIDLRDYPAPLYDRDLEDESGIPENAAAVKRLMTEHDGFVLACPEYNSGITPLLKNVIDWASRPEQGTPSRAFKGKTALLLSASPGRLGGLRGLVQVRSILTTLGVLVLPGQQAIPHAAAAFEDDGSLADENVDARVRSLVRELLDTIDRLST